MSTAPLRRSSRTLATKTEAPEPLTKKAPPKKRGRADKASQHAAPSEPSSMGPPPSTPNKRRKVASETKPPPLTPTPSAIKLMTSSSNMKPTAHSLDDLSTRPAEPHHTNATLVTPRGTQVQPTFDSSSSSPSKPPRPTPQTTTQNLLQTACKNLTTVDPALQPLISAHHCHAFSPEGLVEEIDPFRALTTGIMAQQVSGAAANSIKKKFIALFPASDAPNGFPTPQAVSTTPLPKLREAGLSQRKAEYVQGLAEKFSTGELTVRMLMNGSDDEVMEKLVAVRGLGVWSVQMFMCFGLKRMDVFSTGDLGVQRGMAAYVGRDVAKLKNKGGGNKWKYMSEKEMVEVSDRFKPYRSLFMWYMWRIEDVDVSAVQDNAS